jgi:hypothetical protein
MNAHLDIRRVTLDGYSPRRREHFARALTTQLARRGAPAGQARQAADAILDAVDGRLAAGLHGSPGGRRRDG